MHAHHRQRDARREQHPQEHRPCPVESGQGDGPRQEPPRLRPEHLYRGGPHQAVSNLLRTGAAEPPRHGPPAAGALLRAGEAGRGPHAVGNHAGAQRPVPGAGRHGLCADYGPPLRELPALSGRVDPPALREGGSAPHGGQRRAGPRLCLLSEDGEGMPAEYRHPLHEVFEKDYQSGLRQ